MDRKKVEISVVTTKSEAKKLWLKYCSDDEVWNTWEFRELFLDIYNNPIYFVVAKNSHEIIGVLPLWFDKQENRYEWVSGWWAEKSKYYATNKLVLDEMLDFVPGKISLEAMTGSTAKMIGTGVIRDYDHYGVDLKKVGGSWEGYLEGLKRKKRQTIKWDIRRLEKLNPIVRYDHPGDLKYLFTLNIERMKQKTKIYDDEDESVFETDKFQIPAFEEMWKRSGQKFITRIASVVINGRVVSCDLSLVYKKRYYTLLGGQDIERAPGIGAYANYLDIKDAIAYGCNYVDFCMEDHHWKKDWFRSTPRYKYLRDAMKVSGRKDFSRSYLELG